MKLADVENVNGALDAEVMQLAGHFKEQQVILRWREERDECDCNEGKENASS